MEKKKKRYNQLKEFEFFFKDHVIDTVMDEQF